MKKWLLGAVLGGFSMAVMAQIATYVGTEAQQGAEAFDRKVLVERYYNECLNSVCLTSEERDCPQKCRELAEDKADVEQ